MVESDCPTCGEFRSMQELVRNMQNEYLQEISRLKDRVSPNINAYICITTNMTKIFFSLTVFGYMIQSQMSSKAVMDLI